MSHSCCVIRGNHIGLLQQWIIQRWWLFFPHVEPCAQKMARCESVQECRFVVNTASRGRHEYCALLHAGKCRCIQHLQRVLVARTMQRDEVGALQEALES